MLTGASDNQILTEGALWARAEAKMSVSMAMVEDRKHCREAWHNAGSAVEFALKAVIMRRERYNIWPSKEAKPELHTHNLRSLFRLAAIDLHSAPKALRGSVRTALDWDRGHDYNPGTMKRSVARSMVNAVCGPEGVVAWLKTC